MSDSTQFENTAKSAKDVIDEAIREVEREIASTPEGFVMLVQYWAKGWESD